MGYKRQTTGVLKVGFYQQHQLDYSASEFVILIFFLIPVWKMLQLQSTV